MRKACIRAKKNPEFFHKAHANCVLPVAVENAIVAFILATSRRGIGLASRETLELLKLALGRKVTKAWLNGIRGRFASTIKPRLPSAMDAERIGTLSQQKLDVFIEALGSYERYILKDGSNFVNVDEVPASYAGIDCTKLLAAVDFAKLGQINARASDLRTVVPFVAADGTPWMVVLVFRGPADEKSFTLHMDLDLLKRASRRMEVVFAFTSKGFINKIVWRSIMRHYARVSAWRTLGKGSVLVTDNLSAHLDTQSLKFLAENNVKVIFIPPHTSHFLQPLDNGVNAQLQKGYHAKKRSATRTCVLNGGQISHLAATLMLETAMEELTRPVIVGAFRRCGIWPIDEEIIRELAEPYLAPPEVSKPPLPSHPSSVESLQLLSKALLEKNSKRKVVSVQLDPELDKTSTGDQVLARAAAIEKAKAAQAKEKEQARKDRMVASEERAKILQREKEEKEERKAKREEAKKRRRELETIESGWRKCRQECGRVKTGANKWWFCINCTDLGLCGTCYEDHQNRAREVWHCPKCEIPLTPFAPSQLDP